jgi:hypothetical protein
MVMPHTPNFIRDLLFNGGGLYPPVKPDISFGNYFLRWDDGSIGLYSNEVLKFKSFVRSMIPNLEPIMKMINSVSGPKNDPVRRTVTDKGQFSVTGKYNGRISFILNVDTGGSTVLFREERILIDDGLLEEMRLHYGSKGLALFNNLKHMDNIVSVKWKIGDLLFNRVKHGK